MGNFKNGVNTGIREISAIFLNPRFTQKAACPIKKEKWGICSQCLKYIKTTFYFRLTTFDLNYFSIFINNLLQKKNNSLIW